MQIKNCVFIVTGGGSGLGAAVARTLVANGEQVVVADIDRAAGGAIAVELGDNLRFAPTDVTSEADGIAAVSLPGYVRSPPWAGELRRRGAGREGVGSRRSASTGIFARAVSINLIGTFNMLRLAAAAIVEEMPGGGRRTRGHRQHGLDRRLRRADRPGRLRGSKGGVAALTLPAARELARYGIRVVTIAPGIFDTPMMAAMPQECTTPWHQRAFPDTPGPPGRICRPGQHICENAMLNGEVIRLDGALRMAPR